MKLLSCVLLGSALLMTACGGNSSSSSTTTPGGSSSNFPPIPKVDPNRPTEGRAAVMNVPWAPKGQIVSKGGLTFARYLMITEDELQNAIICGKKVDGKFKWVKPVAASQIRWTQDGFTTLENDETRGKIDDELDCGAHIKIDMEYVYNLKNNGTELELVNITNGKKQDLEIFKPALP